MINAEDREYLNVIRGVSIFRVVLAHLGLSWIYPPYSSYVSVFLPLLFFVSGAVSFNSYRRAESSIGYLVKRLVTISVPYYLLILLAFSMVWLVRPDWSEIDSYVVFQCLTFNPVVVQESMPYPLGPIWFLHSLVVIILISPIFFGVARQHPGFLLFGIFLSLCIGSLQHLFKINSFLYISGHNFYQPLAHLGFFLFGAYFYANKHYFSRRNKLVLFVGLSVLSILLATIFIEDININRHSYSPDLFYILCSYTSIFIFLAFQNEITIVFNNIKFISKFLMFMSNNSYAIFVLHSFVIVSIEKHLGLVGVMGDPVKAATKVVLSVLVTCIVAIPFTHVTKIICKSIQRSKIYVVSQKGSKSKSEIFERTARIKDSQ